MNRFSRLILMILALIYLAPAQAMFSFDSGMSLCQVYAEDDAKDGDKKDGKKEGEEEPDCD